MHQDKDCNHWLTPFWLTDLQLKAEAIIGDCNNGWVADGNTVCVYVAKDSNDFVAEASHHTIAEYIASANPTIMLAMIDKIQTLQNALKIKPPAQSTTYTKTITSTLLAELRKKAEYAASGTAYMDEDGNEIWWPAGKEHILSEAEYIEDSEFITTFNPTMILTLLDHIEHLTRGAN